MKMWITIGAIIAIGTVLFEILPSAYWKKIPNTTFRIFLRMVVLVIIGVCSLGAYFANYEHDIRKNYYEIVGDFQSNDQNYKKAIHAYDSALKFCSENDKFEDGVESVQIIHEKIGSSYFYLSDYKGAIKSFDQATKSRTCSAETYYKMAKSNYNLNKNTEALKWIDQALKQKQEESSYLISKALILIHLEKYDQSISIADKILKKDNSNIKALLAKMTCMYRKEGYKEARILSDRIILIEPKNSAAYNMRGLLYSNLDQNIDEAIFNFKQAINLDNSNGIYHYNLAFYYKEKKLYKEALDEVKKSIELDGSDNPANQELLKDIESMVK